MKNYRLLLSYWVLLPLIGVTNMLFAQQAQVERCQNELLVQKMQTQNSSYVEELAQFQSEMGRVSEIPSHHTRAVKVIPVVFHVIHKGTSVGASHNIPESRIREQIEVLNEDYRRQNADANQTPAVFLGVAADMEIEFELAAIAPNGNATTGITRHQYNNIPNVDYIEDVIKAETYWNPNHYLNIWTVPIPNNVSDILGYSYLPTNSILNTHNDGVVLAHNRVGFTSLSTGRTATHEIGHYLGLAHTFGNSNSNTGCNQDDGIADTPNTDSPYFGCPNHPRTSCNSTDMFMNYMDYVDDECMNIFTQGQKNIAQSILTFQRSSLIENAPMVLSNTTVEEAKHIQIFPNPASDILYIDMDETVLHRLEWYNISGQLIRVDELAHRELAHLSVQDIPEGIYFLKMYENQKVWSKKVILQK